MKPLLYIILIAVFVVPGCKKYPEGGPVNSLSGTAERISGSYSIDAWMVNDLDSTAELKAKFASCESAALRFTLINDAVKRLESDCFTLPENSWETDKEKITLSFSRTADAVEIFPLICNRAMSVYWDIERLNKKWLWIKTTVNGNRYYLRLKRNR